MRLPQAGRAGGRGAGRQTASSAACRSAASDPGRADRSPTCCCWPRPRPSTEDDMDPLDAGAEGGAVDERVEPGRCSARRRRRRRCAGETFTGNRGLQIEEPLIFEQDRPAAAASICRSRRRSRDRLDGLERAGADRPARAQRAAGGAPLHAARRRRTTPSTRALSAGLVHHEAQPAPQREDGAAARLRRPPSAAAGLDRAGRARADRHAGALAEDADRHAGGGDVARRPARMASCAA